MNVTEEARVERIRCVHEIQRQMNMEPRHDSRLTHQYANAEIDWDATQVAKELVAVDFIYKNTLYGEFIEEYMRSLANLIRAEYRIPWGDTWEIVRFYAPTALKLQCLLQTGQRVPQKLSPNEYNLGENCGEASVLGATA
jgi:hypothetical protein